MYAQPYACMLHAQHKHPGMHTFAHKCIQRHTRWAYPGSSKAWLRIPSKLPASALPKLFSVTPLTWRAYFACGKQLASALASWSGPGIQLCKVWGYLGCFPARWVWPLQCCTADVHQHKIRGKQMYHQLVK